VLTGALVAGPADTDDSYKDLRSDYVTNEVGAWCVQHVDTTASAVEGHGRWRLLLRHACCTLACLLHACSLLTAHSQHEFSTSMLLQVAIDYNAGLTGALAGLLAMLE
jgi:hypothetical protein